MTEATARFAIFAVLLAGILMACGNAAPEQTEEAAADTIAPESDEACILVEEGYGPAGTEEVEAEEVVSGLEVPWGIAFLPDGEMLVTERPGRVRLVQDGELVSEPVAEIATTGTGEGGLLGIAAHPDFAENRYFYLYYASAGANQVERWILSDDGRSASADRIVVSDIPSARYHNGGRMRFGPDGMLYIGTGDARESSRAQDRTNLAGKVLRVDADGEIPGDNPFTGSPVYLTGIRNTQGFDWPDESTIWLTDHGPTGEMGLQGLDEVNVAQSGDNLGWPDIYGCDEGPEMITPVLTWESAVPPGGAAIYRGEARPSWQGDLLVGTLRSEHLHRVSISGKSVERHEVYLRGTSPQGFGRLREVIMGPDGYLYVTTSNCDGRGNCPSEQDKILRIAG